MQLLAWILQGPIFHAQLQALCSADGQCLQAVILKLPSLAISNARDGFFINSGHLTSLAPLPVAAQMASKGMLERFHSYLGDDKAGFRRQWQDSANLFELNLSLTNVGRI